MGFSLKKMLKNPVALAGGAAGVGVGGGVAGGITAGVTGGLLGQALTPNGAAATAPDGTPIDLRRKGGGGLSAEQKLNSALGTYEKVDERLSGHELEMSQKYGPLYAQLMNEMASKERAGQVADVEALAPKLQGIRDAAEGPETTQMRKTLMAQIMGELSAGSSLTDQQNRELEQGVRSSEMARGVGLGRGAAGREAIKRALQGQRLLAQRQSKAMGLVQQEEAATPDPFSAILSGGTPQTAAALSSSRAATSQVNPMSVFNIMSKGGGGGGANRQNMLQLALADPDLDPALKNRVII